MSKMVTGFRKQFKERYEYYRKNWLFLTLIIGIEVFFILSMVMSSGLLLTEIQMRLYDTVQIISNDPVELSEGIPSEDSVARMLRNYPALEKDFAFVGQKFLLLFTIIFIINYISQYLTFFLIKRKLKKKMNKMPLQFSLAYISSYFLFMAIFLLFSNIYYLIIKNQYDVLTNLLSFVLISCIIIVSYFMMTILSTAGSKNYFKTIYKLAINKRTMYTYFFLIGISVAVFKLLSWTASFAPGISYTLLVIGMIKIFEMFKIELVNTL